MQCPQCGFVNLDGMKFCGECGSRLPANEYAPEPRPEQTPTKAISEPERKIVTALFSDLTGYTALTERLDPEQVKEITGQVFAGVKGIISKYEGFIDRLLGDGVLVLFGVPKAHEDDPVRAVQAAMEIHEFVKGLSPRIEGRLGVPLSMHSGINTGLVVTAEVDPEKGTWRLVSWLIFINWRWRSVRKIPRTWPISANRPIKTERRRCGIPGNMRLTEPRSSD